MKVTFYGTRGSLPVSRPDSVKYGGNTTCLRIQSSCLPDGQWLIVDAGSGIGPLTTDFFRGGGKAATILHTHYHHDHTMGFPLSGLCHAKGIPVNMYGPFEHGVGAREVYDTLMKSPLFPVNFRRVSSHIFCHRIEDANSQVIVVHPEGGTKQFSLDEFERLTEKEGRQLPFSKTQKFSVKECLVIRMYRSNHPEQTISYRFEEGPTGGKVFVFVTDHENQDGVPVDFKAHLQGADLLVMDCQYSREKYEKQTAGWGHATPDYVANVARESKAKVLGLTHHDPSSNDAMIDSIVATAQNVLAEEGITVFGCADYQMVTVE